MLENVLSYLALIGGVIAFLMRDVEVACFFVLLGIYYRLVAINQQGKH